ncbi:hypothetical protein C4D60_Mb11t04530 [Musa balbisiana]|uniref:Uncharacterized protein n=1 Tax=Musa balbisiana TaxID=52838 RepID=A0A4S8J364_MUSBA|nr:hypothetical protein C4D60_Mb11t04530 [Musa balbisiana]
MQEVFTPTWSKSLIVLVASGIVPSSPSTLSPAPLSSKAKSLWTHRCFLAPFRPLPCFNTFVFSKQIPLVNGKTDCNSHAWPLPSRYRICTDSVLLSFLGSNVRLLDLVL